VSAATLTQGQVMGWNLAFSAGACAVSFAAVSPRFAAGLALGALLEAANFRSLFRSCERIFFGGGPGAGAAIATFGLRFVLLGAVIFVALRAGVHPAGLLVGLSLIVPASVLAAWRARPPLDPAAPALAGDDPAWERWNPWLARERDEAEEEEES
jgi:hypothetical protein